MQKRIDRQTAAYRQLQEQHEALQKQLQENAPKKDDTPKEEDFDTYEEYNEALVEYRAEQRLAEKERERLEAQRAEKEAQMREATEKQYASRVEAFAEKHPDFREKESVVEEVVALQMQNGVTPTLQALTNAVLESENSARLVYELGNDVDLLEDILQKSPYQAVRELVKLEMKPEAVENKKQPPKPIKATSGKSTGKKSVNQMSGKELLKWATS